MSLEAGLITAQALAEALGLSVETIWRYTREKRIPYVAIGQRQYRYRLPEVLDAIAGHDQVQERPAACASETLSKLTYADYLLLPEEPGFRHEILDGVLVREPSPVVLHQRVARRLQRLLEDYFAVSAPGGEVFNAPLDVTLGDHTVVQPDIFVMIVGQEQQILHARIDGPPALVVEVLSPSTSRKDRMRKLRIYQQARVPHYWLVNPDEQTLECFAWRDGSYAVVANGLDDEVVAHPDFPELAIELSRLW